MFPVVCATVELRGPACGKPAPRRSQQRPKAVEILDSFRPRYETSYDGRKPHPGPTGRSKALVRHGVDPNVVLAAVLGGPAEDIRVRDSAAWDARSPLGVRGPS